MDKVELQCRYPYEASAPHPLESILTAAGFRVSQNHSRPSLFIAIDWSREIEARVRALEGQDVHKIFICQEPKVVLPRAHTAEFLAHFDSVYSLGFPPSEGSTSLPHFFHTPKNLGAELSMSKYTRVALINSNLFAASKGELYSLRRQMARHPMVDTYGRHWDASLSWKVKQLLSSTLLCLEAGHPLSANGWRFNRSPAALKGLSDDKYVTLASYKATLAIENSREYTSEKLMQPIIAGCIPIYVGSSHVTRELPAGLVVECDATKSSVSQGIRVALEADMDAWNGIRADFLQSPKFTELSGESVFSTISSLEGLG